MPPQKGFAQISVVAIVIIFFITVAILVFQILPMYDLHLFGDPRLKLRKQYEQKLKETLVINENNETVVRGKVSHTTLGCESGKENCHLVIQFNNLPLNIYYLYSPKGSCENKETAKQVEDINNGDLIEVSGFYYALGSISTCDSEKYYIKKIEPLVDVQKWEIFVPAEDQFCMNAADCVRVGTNCSDCSCGEAVNKQLEQKYINLYKSVCDKYKGPVCEFYCKTPYPNCINNKCTLSDKRPQSTTKETVRLCEVENPNYDYDEECKKTIQLKYPGKNCSYGLGVTEWQAFGSCRNCTIECY